MNLRFDSFKKFKTVQKLQDGLCTRIEVEVPHHAMLMYLTDSDVRNIRDQCNKILNGKDEPIIYLSNIITIEEVTNE